MNEFLAKALLDLSKRSFELMHEPLTNYELFSQKLSERIRVKEGGNEQFDFDVELDKLVQRTLAQHGITGWVFSEESKVFEIPGAKRFRVVYDPFCNSSLASRTFREGALGISIFSYDYDFLAAAILDFQTGLVGLVTAGQKTKFYQAQTGQMVGIDRPAATSLDEAWVVLTLEDQAERSHLAAAEPLLRQAKRIIDSSGHIYWLRLAAGFVDGYADPFGGEALYEMFACTVAQGAGSVVTNLDGEAFDPSQYLLTFEHDPGYHFYPVAARTKELHGHLMEALGYTRAHE
jgi:fructose-1,6-bisphosphatase/inositol monophosphatase family enzyme